MFIGLLRACITEIFGKSLASTSKVSMKYVSLNNRPCQPRRTLVGINSNKALFYPVTFSVNNFGRICNTINDLYARICVPKKVKNMNLKYVGV